MTSKFPDDIITAAQKSQHDWLVPSSVSLAQWAIESGYGQHMPTDSNNPFGIKAKADQPFVTSNTREVINGKTVIIPQKFRKFADFAEAFDAHARLLATVSVYAPAMTAWKSGDLEGGVRLMGAHYATDPNYASVINGLIKSQNLSQYDHPVPITAPVAPPVPAIEPNPLEKLKMNLSLFSLLLNLLPVLPMLEQDFELEVKNLTSSEDGKTKAIQTLHLLEDASKKLRAALGDKAP